MSPVYRKEGKRERRIQNQVHELEATFAQVIETLLGEGWKKKKRCVGYGSKCAGSQEGMFRTVVVLEFGDEEIKLEHEGRATPPPEAKDFTGEIVIFVGRAGKWDIDTHL